MAGIRLNDITIRHTLKPGDLGEIVSMHGEAYHEDYGYDLHFESYVAGGIHLFYEKYNPATDRIWLCEHEGKLAGTCALQLKEEKAHLHFFLILSSYRGIGLGKQLMKLFMEFMQEKNYRKATLLTISELSSAIYLYKMAGFYLKDEIPNEDFGKKILLQRYEWETL